jgi:hypothetical protein
MAVLDSVLHLGIKAIRITTDVIHAVPIDPTVSQNALIAVTISRTGCVQTAKSKRKVGQGKSRNAPF